MNDKADEPDLSAVLMIRVIPRAKKGEISEVLQDGTIKIRLTAPPVDGKANKALIQFLSEILDVPKSCLEIISGSKGRNKMVRVNGFDEQTIRMRINQEVD